MSTFEWLPKEEMHALARPFFQAAASPRNAGREQNYIEFLDEEIKEMVASEHKRRKLLRHFAELGPQTISEVLAVVARSSTDMAIVLDNFRPRLLHIDVDGQLRKENFLIMSSKGLEHDIDIHGKGAAAITAVRFVTGIKSAASVPTTEGPAELEALDGPAAASKPVQAEGKLKLPS